MGVLPRMCSSGDVHSLATRVALFSRTQGHEWQEATVIMAKLAFPKEPGASQTRPSLSQPQGYFLCCLAAFCTPHAHCKCSSHFLTPLHLQTHPGKLQAVVGFPLLDPVAPVEEVAVPSPTEVPDRRALPADQQHRGSASFSLSLVSPIQGTFNCYFFTLTSKNSTCISFPSVVDRE